MSDVFISSQGEMTYGGSGPGPEDGKIIQLVHSGEYFKYCAKDNLYYKVDI